METFLLVASDWNLRQLYHELFFSQKETEIVPVDTIEHSIVLLSFKKFDAVIIHLVDLNNRDILTFIRLRKRQEKWKKIPLILLTPEVDLYKTLLLKTDLIINPLLGTPLELVHRVHAHIKH